MATTVFTVGHSNRTLQEFLQILGSHGIERLADVRTVRRSRHNPQFNEEPLRDALARSEVGYFVLPALGGLRKPRRDSPNAAWKNASFRGYADHMATPEFEDGLRGLLDLAREKRTAIMCAEAVPWRCHRSLIADALVARGIEAVHLFDETRSGPHRMTAFARVESGRVSYPGEQGALFEG